MSEGDLVRLAVGLGATRVGGPLSDDERSLIESTRTPRSASALVEDTATAIRLGRDPLGDALCQLRSSAERRSVGAVYTPAHLVAPMVEWVVAQEPRRVIDAGAGSGRFSLAVARRGAGVDVVAVESDPLACLLTRAGLAALGYRKARVINGDYLRLDLPKQTGRTAFIGNPPYVRHHNLAPRTKRWAQLAARSAGYHVSGLAGLHALFYLATALHAQKEDVGCFVTSAEWLDVNYGAIVRELFVRQLGGQSLHVLEPTLLPFEGAATTAAIACFQVGTESRVVRLRSVKSLRSLSALSTGVEVSRVRLAEAKRWTPIVRTSAKMPEGYIELGELCRVHRGQVTGANSVWVVAQDFVGLPDRILRPAVTRARELFAAGAVLSDAAKLRRVIDLPTDLDLFDSDERQCVESFLRGARRLGAHRGYIAKNRRAWWSVGLKEPAPILATYMARRAPAFVRNLAEARHINIAHGLYPRERMSDIALDRLAAALRTSVSTSSGRTYAGGLTKFEPREMERLAVPSLEVLLAA